MYRVIRDRGSFRIVFVMALAMALMGALYVLAQAQTGGAPAPSWRRVPQGAGALPAANAPGQGRLHRPRRAASAQTSSNAYTESVLYGFSGFCTQPGCANGTYPEAGLVEDASGNLYGTTSVGGSGISGGTVFKLAPNGDGSYSESVLYSFCSQGGTSCTDGANPLASLIKDASGNLYGTTANGGANYSSNCSNGSCGTVFKLAPNGNGGYSETVLYSFCSQGGTSCTDGANPLAGLIEDSSGNLYGTTWQGGATIPFGDRTTTAGTVFKLTPNGEGGYSESVLYTFCSQSGCADGEWPEAGLIEDASGNFYGTTSAGGATIILNGYTTTGGAAFKLTPKGDGSYSESVLYNFCSQSGCTDGLGPSTSLIEDASGNLFGTTWQGGANCQYGYDGAGCGTVFKLVQNGDGGYSENVLYSFCAQGGTGCPDGYAPSSGVIEDASGNLFGTTFDGGVYDVYGDGGTVFELTPSGLGYTETVLYSFCAQNSPTIACTDGESPQGGVIEDASGNFYGTSDGGGPNYYGTVFKLSPPPPGFTVSANPTSLMLKAGQSGTAALTVTPENGFDSTVSFACSGLPAEASCSFNPQTVTPSGGQPATTTVTISTTAPMSAALRGAGRNPQAAYVLLLPGLALGLVGAARGKATRRGLHLRGLLMPLGLVLALASCGGSGSGGGGGNTGTPPGTSTVTVTAGGTGGTSQTTILTLTVTQ